jgi:3-phenylpropionate/trans-cinnamate dioxygenase ferredoxin reductase subunit
VTELDRIVIVGAGQAGASLAAKLRELGHAGPITLIGEEAYLPYERPPLSKAYLLGKLERDRLFLRPADFYAKRGIDVITATRVRAIDRARRHVLLDAGQLEYDVLALTTGSQARRLPASLGAGLSGVFTIRTLADVDALAKAHRPQGHALLVGGGYIGLEAAAVLRSLGMRVTLVEVADRLLQRVASPETAGYFRALHLRHGVDIREATALDHLTGEGQVSGAVLSDGTCLDVDLVIVGIGVVPCDALARDSGLETEGGVVVDEHGCTGDPAVWAAGDCTLFPYKGRRVRLESVPNAIEQANLVAANILGARESYRPVPWFWSDQYDVKLQIAGLSAGYDRVVVRHGRREGSVSHWHFVGTTLLAVDAMNDPRSFMLAKQLLQAGTPVEPDRISDPALELTGFSPQAPGRPGG